MALLSQGPLQRLVGSSYRPIIGIVSLIIFIIYIITPSSRPSASLIITTTSSSDLSWLPPSSAHPYKIHAIDTSRPYISPNTSEEILLSKSPTALTILTFLIDNYHTLPEVSFFHHDQHQAWHSIYTSPFEIQHLQLENVIKHGYVSPRCLPGCENVIPVASALASPLNELKGSPREVQISSVIKEFNVEHARDIGKGMGRVPKKIAAPCCSTFAVSRERVLRREREWYEALRRWVWETELSGVQAGKILEYTWHLWFGMEDVFCPSEAQCLCDVYNIGVCDREL
ncbi:Di-copper centre-containing protein [Rutstroemia sp. NJR-2017a WRK4]|nr:Di-copper centre-containing protein [Rutstroemia sp. NJR-2017a WRK4]